MYDDYLDYSDESQEDYLEHHGILGMKWGVRKYQDSNGNWTEEGLERRRQGKAREIAGNISNTARRANEKITTAARKTFRPTAADMDEKIARAREKQLIKDKKKELAVIQGRNRKIKDMTDKEIFDEIQSRRNRMTLEEMRRDASKIHQGKEFTVAAVGTTAKIVSAPAKALGKIVADTASYGLTTAGKTFIDTVAYNVSTNAKNKSAYKHRNESQVLKDKLQDAKNKRDLEDVRYEDSLRDMRNATARNKAMYDLSSSYLRRSVLDADEQGSAKSAERLDREKKASGGKYSADGDRKKDQQKQGLSKQQKEDMREVFREMAREQEEQKRLKKQNRKKNQNS